MDRIKEKLGPSWSMQVSDLIGTEHHKERYGLLWRNTVISLISPTSLLSDISNNFVRDPFMGYFRAGIFDFVIATIHVVWGSTMEGRREEIRKLDTVLKKILERTGAEKDVILVGDFNMPPDDLCWEVDGWLPLIRPPWKTTVGDVSLYDNIWVHAEYTFNSEYKGECGVLEFDKIIYDEGSRRTAINEVSDHRPVWGLFSTNVDDDDEAEFDLANIQV